MNRFLLIFLTAITLIGCRVKINSPYNEYVSMELPDSHTACINFSKKHNVISVGIDINKEGERFCRTHYSGEVDYIGRKATYKFPLEQKYISKDLTKKELKFYKENSPIEMEVQYMPREKAYSIHFFNSKCPLLNTGKQEVGYNIRMGKLTRDANENPTFWRKTKVFMTKRVIALRDAIDGAFDYVFGDISFVSHWWFLFYLGGLLFVAIGLKIFTPLVWIGVIMQYAYLQFMSPPFFMLWPSIVGWGWTIICVIPIILIVAFNFAMCVAVIVSAFTHWLSFLILIVPAFIAILSIFTLLDIAFTDHLELLVFFLLGAGAESYTLVGTFTDVNGNVFKVYKK